eukprot:7310937-Pyramimonas_sp.AAC.1
MRAWIKGGPDYDDFVMALDTWADQPNIVADCRRHQTTGDIDSYWTLLQQGLTEAAHTYFERR